MARIDRCLVAALAFATGGVCFTAAAFGADTGAQACGPTSYTYAGIQTNRGTHGIAATIAAVRPPSVANGHVAGWVGVGGPGEGAGGQNAWIQIGLNSFPGRGNTIYAEAWVPGQGQLYKELDGVPVGQKIRLAVLEVRGQPGVWRAWAGGRPVTKPVRLPGSEGGVWTADAVAESWNGGTPVCNGYSYRFENVALARAAGGSWQRVKSVATLQDPGYSVVRHGSSFVAASN